mgnify:FL=1
MFANAVTGGLATDTDKEVFDNFGKYAGGFKGDATGHNTGKHVLWGTGGRCLLFSCEDKLDAITNSVKTRKHYESDSFNYKIKIVDEYVRSSLLGTFLCNFRQ